MFCYRRFGHNEGDEPAFTQPKMYKKIRSHETVVTLYSRRLIEEGVITEGEFEKMKADWRAHLEASSTSARATSPTRPTGSTGNGRARTPTTRMSSAAARPACRSSTLRELGKKLSEVPEGFKAHRTIQRFMDNRAKMIESGEGIDWAMAEALAFGSLVQEGTKIRLSGQDVERGTFSQRHSVLYDQETEERYIPLANMAPNQARYEVINSMLSEEAVLGFEYGYSLARPNALTLWEAQFGDFANGAQVLFDQFISSGERKWLRMSGLVCLLPHGYEGQGPEHSSARLERFLQMCAEDNMQVANCTTPANYFHILRRQMKRDFRKPLIMMTPKSLLGTSGRSRRSEMSGDTSFHRLLWDDAELLKNEPIKLVKDNKIRRVVMCSGKVYFDLYEEREKRGIDDIYLLSARTALSVPGQGPDQRAVALPQRRDGLVPGRAQEHGRLVVHRSLSGMGAGAYRCQVSARPLHRPSGFGLDGDRPDVAAPCTA
jgi:2-oxoglutarate dehydrogenase E1 component